MKTRKPRLTQCSECSYPYAGDGCTNPACYANPKVSDATKAIGRERDAIRKAEEAERQRIRDIQASMRSR